MNFAYSTISQTDNIATVTVESNDGSLFADVPVKVTIWPAGVTPRRGNAEIAKVTARVGDQLTIERSVEGPSGRRIITVGDQIASTITAGMLDAIRKNLEITTSGPDKVAFVVVGTSNQTVNTIEVRTIDGEVVFAVDTETLTAYAREWQTGQAITMAPDGIFRGDGYSRFFIINPVIKTIEEAEQASLIVRKILNQTTALQEWQDENGAVVASVSPTGVLSVLSVNFAGEISPSQITGTAIVENDSRLSDARPPTAHTHLESDVVNLVGDLTSLSNGIISLSEDPRFSDARTPTAHVHPESEVTNLVADLTTLTSNLAAKESTANKNVAGGYAGLDGASKLNGSQQVYGAAANTAAVGNDARLSDARTPTAHVHPESEVTNLVADLAAKEVRASKNIAGGYAGLDGASKLTGSQQVYGTVANTAAVGNDSRLSDSRVPTAHAASHASAGSDPLTLSESQVTNLTTDLTARELTANKNAVNGYPGLDAGGNLPVILFSNGTFTVLATKTDTGAVNNWAPGLDGNTLIPWAGAADVTFSGLAGGVAGQLVIVRNTGTKVAYFPHQSGSSSAGNKWTNIATSGPTPIAPGGHVIYQYDGATWQLISHEQGAWITPAFSAANFAGNGTMTWTVDAGDVTAFRFRLSGRTLSVVCIIGTSTVGSVLTSALKVTIPGGFTGAAQAGGFNKNVDNNGPGAIGLVSVFAATTIFVYRDPTASTVWSNSTNLTLVDFNFTFDVQ